MNFLAGLKRRETPYFELTDGLQKHLTYNINNDIIITVIAAYL